MSKLRIAFKVVLFLAGLLVYTWVADYAFIAVSEPDTIAVMVGAVLFLILLGIAIVFIGYFGTKLINHLTKEEGKK